MVFLCPGCGAAHSGALLIRDRKESVRNGPGSAEQHYVPHRVRDTSAMKHFIVVPAQAGTHNRRILSCSEMAERFILNASTGLMGPGLRRDDP
jgi:hypothetical protein